MSELNIYPVMGKFFNFYIFYVLSLLSLYAFSTYWRISAKFFVDLFVVFHVFIVAVCVAHVSLSFLFSEKVWTLLTSRA